MSPDYSVTDLPDRSLNNSTSHTGAASTDGVWMIGVVVTSGMDHQRAAHYIGNLKPGCQYWIICITHGIYEQRGQIAEMPITPRQAMALACGWIVMPSRRQCGHHLPVFFLGLATWIFVHMQAM